MRESDMENFLLVLPDLVGAVTAWIISPEQQTSRYHDGKDGDMRATIRPADDRPSQGQHNGNQQRPHRRPHGHRDGKPDGHQRKIKPPRSRDWRTLEPAPAAPAMENRFVAHEEGHHAK